MHCEAKSAIIPLPTEGYRSGHNGAVLKTVRAKVHRGSNPLPSARTLSVNDVALGVKSP